MTESTIPSHLESIRRISFTRIMTEAPANSLTHTTSIDGVMINPGTPEGTEPHLAKISPTGVNMNIT